MCKSIAIIAVILIRVPRSAMPGRTGRFGRKGISINFVHDKRTWQQMEIIEKATGKQIIRVETSDLDTMEDVRICVACEFLLAFRELTRQFVHSK